MKVLNWLKRNGESIGSPIALVALLFIIFSAVWGIYRPAMLPVLSVSLALFGTGLGLISIGIANKHDMELQRIEGILKVRDVDLVSIPPTRKDVTIEVPTAHIAVQGFPPSVEIKGETLANTQARLDEDTNRVGFIRGELYKLDDGSWGIHWGGKHPL